MAGSKRKNTYQVRDSKISNEISREIVIERERKHISIRSTIRTRKPKKESDRMLAGCDGCQEIVKAEVKTINAKEWNLHICDVSLSASFECGKIDCRYSIGACCIEYQFCPECFANKEIVKKTFEEGISFP